MRLKGDVITLELRTYTAQGREPSAENFMPVSLTLSPKSAFRSK